jgi:hypothetical protein
MAETKIYKLARSIPKRSISALELATKVANDHHDRFGTRASGETVVLVSELGFMELIYHVAVYKPEPRLLRKDRMVLLGSEELRDGNFDEAYAKFEDAVNA